MAGLLMAVTITDYAASSPPDPLGESSSSSVQMVVGTLEPTDPCGAIITIVGASASTPLTEGTTDTLRIPRPEEIQRGDLMVAVSAHGNSGSPTVTAPPGWQLLRVDSWPGTSANAQRVWWKFAEEEEPDFYDWVLSLAKHPVGGIVAYRDASLHMHAGHVQEELQSVKDVLAPSFEPQINDCVLVFLGSVLSSPSATVSFTASDVLEMRVDTTVAPRGAFIADVRTAEISDQNDLQVVVANDVEQIAWSSALVSLSPKPGRKIAGGPGWRMLSSPVTDFTIADLEEQTGIQGVSGAAFGTEHPSNIYQYYDGTAWNSPSHVMDGLRPGRGFILYFFDDDRHGEHEMPLNLKAPGNSPVYNVQVPLHTNGDQFNLLGNPFGVPIDVSKLTVFGKIQSTVQVWKEGPDSATGSFVLVSIDEPHVTISPWQAFFIENVNATQAVIPKAAMTEGNAVNGPYSPESPMVAFHLTGQVDDGQSKIFDEAGILYFHEDAVEVWDRYDASKLRPLTERYAVLSLIGERGEEPVHQAQKSLPLDVSFPLEVPFAFRAVNVSGDFTISWPEWRNIPPHWELTLLDTETDQDTDMREVESYSFSYEEPETALSDWEDFPSQQVSLHGPFDARFLLRIEATSVDVEGVPVPSAVTLRENFPNPFSRSTTIAFSLSRPAQVEIFVYDLLGRRVADLVSGLRAAGEHQVVWDASHMPGGVYIYRMNVEGHSEQRKMVLVK